MINVCWNTVSWREKPWHWENMKRSQTFQSRHFEMFRCRNVRLPETLWSSFARRRGESNISLGRRRNAPRNTFCNYLATWVTKRPWREERWICFSLFFCKRKPRDKSPDRRRDAPRSMFCKDLVTCTTKRPCRDALRNVFCKDFVASTTKPPGGQRNNIFVLVFAMKNWSTCRQVGAEMLRVVFCCKDFVASTTKRHCWDEK